MIDVYVGSSVLGEGQLLGKFTPEQVEQLPRLFETFETSDQEGNECRYRSGRFVIDSNGTHFYIVVKPVGSE